MMAHMIPVYQYAAPSPAVERALGTAMKRLCVSEGHHPNTKPISNVTDAMCRIIEYLDGGTMTISTALDLAMAGEDDLVSQAIVALDRQELVCVVDDLIVWQEEADIWIADNGKQGRLF